MDVLRKELNNIYRRQNLEGEVLSEDMLQQALVKVRALAEVTGLCCIVTDMAADRCWFFPGRSAELLGLTEDEKSITVITSSDEDFLYERMHPSDLVDLRMLEYEFFTEMDSRLPAEKLQSRAVGIISMRGKDNEYAEIEKSTCVLTLAPNGGMWLVLCCYGPSLHPKPLKGINPMIINLMTGEISNCLHFEDRRESILTEREKGILRLIQHGKLSKEIALALGISVHTVNRHRQNILEKLSVDNSIEAVNAAVAMRLL